MADDAPNTTPVQDSGASSAPNPAPESTSVATPQVDAGSPGAANTKGDSKETLLDAVLKVVPTTPEADVLDAPGDKSDTPQSQPKDEDKADAEADEASDDTSDDDDAPPETTPAVRKKINKLLRQRRELRDEVSRLAPTAEIGNELQTFAATNDLSGDDIIRALHLTAAIRHGDYEGFYKAIGPYVRRAQEYLGIVLPDDLHARVEKGEMTFKSAAEFARTRYDSERVQAENQSVRAAHVATRVQSLQTDVQRTVTAFENRLAASDPDYKAKADSVRRTAQAILFERGGTINTVEDALAITREAYDEVNKQFRRLQPAPRATSQLPNGHGQTPAARAQPKTLMEAALQGLQTSRG